MITLKSILGDVATYFIDVYYQGGPTVTSVSTTVASTNSFSFNFGSFFQNTANLLAQSASYYYKLNLFTNSALIPVYAPFTRTGTTATVKAVLLSNCATSACLLTDTSATVTYLCVDAGSCAVVSLSSKGYFTLTPTAPVNTPTTIYNALYLTGNNQSNDMKRLCLSLSLSLSLSHTHTHTHTQFHSFILTSLCFVVCMVDRSE
jgi:hypothetical protein